LGEVQSKGMKRPCSKKKTSVIIANHPFSERRKTIGKKGLYGKRKKAAAGKRGRREGKVQKIAVKVLCLASSLRRGEWLVKRSSKRANRRVVREKTQLVSVGSNGKNRLILLGDEIGDAREQQLKPYSAGW